MDWYYADGPQSCQLVDAGRLAELVADGTVTADTLVWAETLDDWTPCCVALPELFSTAAVDQPAQPPALSPADLRRARGASASGGALLAAPNAPNAPNTEVDPWAVSSLVTGILGLFCCQLLAIPAIVCGHVGLKAANEGRCGGSSKGLAIGGLITGYLSLLIVAAFIVYYLIVILSVFSSLDP